MSDKPAFGDTDTRQEAEYPDFETETYDHHNAQTGKRTLVIYDAESPLGWIESDVAVDLEEMA